MTYQIMPYSHMVRVGVNQKVSKNRKGSKKTRQNGSRQFHSAPFQNLPIQKQMDFYAKNRKFSNSPYSSLVNRQEVEQYFVPLATVLQTGIEHKIIKNVTFDILTAFMYHPITVLANPGLSQDFKLNEDNIEVAL